MPNRVDSEAFGCFFFFLSLAQRNLFFFFFPQADFDVHVSHLVRLVCVHLSSRFVSLSVCQPSELDITEEMKMMMMMTMIITGDSLHPERRLAGTQVTNFIFCCSNETLKKCNIRATADSIAAESSRGHKITT